MNRDRIFEVSPEVAMRATCAHTLTTESDDEDEKHVICLRCGAVVETRLSARRFPEDD